MVTALTVFVRVTKPGFEGVYEERTVWPQGRQWVSVRAPNSMPVPDSAMARWDAEGFVEGYPAPIEAREEGSREAYFDPTGGLIVGAAALAAMGGYKVAAGLWQAFLDLTGDAVEAIEEAARQRKISREEAERMKLEVRRRDAELRTKGAQFDEARDWVSAKIRKLMAEGKPQKQAVAIALSMARKRFPGKVPEKEAEMRYFGEVSVERESANSYAVFVNGVRKGIVKGHSSGTWFFVPTGREHVGGIFASSKQDAIDKLVAFVEEPTVKQSRYLGAAYAPPRKFSEVSKDLEARGAKRYLSGKEVECYVDDEGEFEAGDRVRVISGKRAGEIGEIFLLLSAGGSDYEVWFGKGDIEVIPEANLIPIAGKRILNEGADKARGALRSYRSAEGKPQKQAVAIALSMARKRFPGQVPEKEAEMRYGLLQHPWLVIGSNLSSLVMLESMLNAQGVKGPISSIVDLVKKVGSVGKGLWEAVTRGWLTPEQASGVEQEIVEKRGESRSKTGARRYVDDETVFRKEGTNVKTQKYVGAVFERPTRYSDLWKGVEARGAFRRYRMADPLGAAVVDVLKGMEGSVAARDELVGIVAREIGASPMLVREVVRRLISEGVLWETDPGFIEVRPGLLGRIVQGVFATEKPKGEGEKPKKRAVSSAK